MSDMSLKSSKTSPYHHGDLRSALLRAAEKEINATGIESLSLRSIARRADVSHNAPAHHFGDAKGLLTALADVGFQRLVEVQDQLMAAAPDDKNEQFMALGLGYIEFANSHAALFRLMFSSSIPDRTNPGLAVSMKAALDKLAVATRKARSTEGSIAPLDYNDLTAAWVMVHGFADLVNSGFVTSILEATGKSRAEVARDVLRRLDF